MRSLADVRTALAEVVGAFDAAELTASQAEEVVRDAVALANLASTLQALAAKRVADSQSWRHRGHRSPADWLAGQTKSGIGAAAGMLEAADRLADCPGVEARARAGELSGPQTQVLARAVSADPSAESTLLAVAERDGLKTLTDRCRAVEHAASDAEARHARIHARRSLRHWTDQEGAFRLAATLTAEAGAALLSAMAPFERAAFVQARRDGRHEPHEAYAADGLLGLAEAAVSGDSPARADGGGASTPGGRAKRAKPSFVVLVDAAALRRGHTVPGERCEIPGVGPVPVSVLREHAGDAVWHALVTDGVDIRAYASLTRHIPTSLRVALEVRDQRCTFPGCEATSGLEIDHRLPLESGGLTTYENLHRPCYHHHRTTKHADGWTVEGEPGDWRWRPPNGEDLRSGSGSPGRGR